MFSHIVADISIRISVSINIGSEERLRDSRRSLGVLLQLCRWLRHCGVTLQQVLIIVASLEDFLPFLSHC